MSKTFEGRRQLKIVPIVYFSYVIFHQSNVSTKLIAEGQTGYRSMKINWRDADCIYNIFVYKLFKQCYYIPAI